MKEYVISVDLGGTNVRVGIVKNDCTIVKVLREHSLKYDKEALGQQIIRMISSLNYSEYDIDTVGVSACGFVENGIITASPNLYINDFNLKKVIEEAFPSLTVKVVNDANATAFSESIFCRQASPKLLKNILRQPIIHFSVVSVTFICPQSKLL